MAYIDQVNLATDPTFLKRVTYALVKAAIAIKNEVTTTPGHAQRTNWALTVFGNPNACAQQIALGVVTQPLVAGAVTSPTGAVTTTASDTDIDNVISALWNAYCGYL